MIKKIIDKDIHNINLDNYNVFTMFLDNMSYKNFHAYRVDKKVTHKQFIDFFSDVTNKIVHISKIKNYNGLLVSKTIYHHKIAHQL
jgi:hypothetical protein